MTNKFVFHIRNAHPGDMAAALAVIESQPRLTTIAEIVEQAEAMSFTIQDRQRFEALMTAKDLNLVRNEQNILTNKGQQLAILEMNKPDLFGDIVHGLQYTLWVSSDVSANCFSWSYRAICRMFWLNGAIDISDRHALSSKVEVDAREAFGRPDISFSSKSVGGSLLWLSELRPQVIDEQEQRFARRAFCPPELFVMAIDFAYRENGVDYGANLLLNDARRDEICQVCLLEPGNFDRVLEYATAQFDYLEKGLGGGWGQYLTLLRQPELRDFV